MQKKEDVERKLGIDLLQWTEVMDVFHLGEYPLISLFKKNNIRSVARGYYDKQKIMNFYEKWRENENKHNK